MLDDLGTKVPLERLAGFGLSWLIETSPGNHQGGIILAEPVTDGAVAFSYEVGPGFTAQGALDYLQRYHRIDPRVALVRGRATGEIAHHPLQRRRIGDAIRTGLLDEAGATLRVIAPDGAAVPVATLAAHLKRSVASVRATVRLAARAGLVSLDGDLVRMCDATP